MEAPKPEEMSIFTTMSPDSKLKDIRVGKYGIKFGSLKVICSQYGLKYKIHATCTECYGPKNRMTYLIEKLHFSRNQYSYNMF